MRKQRLTQTATESSTAIECADLSFLSRCAWDLVVEITWFGEPNDIAPHELTSDGVEHALFKLEENVGALETFWVITADKLEFGETRSRLTILLSSTHNALDARDVRDALRPGLHHSIRVIPYSDCRGLWHWLHESRPEICVNGGSVLSEPVCVDEWRSADRDES